MTLSGNQMVSLVPELVSPPGAGTNLSQQQSRILQLLQKGPCDSDAHSHRHEDLVSGVFPLTDGLNGSGKHLTRAYHV
jgi:hypothetical protein